MKTSPLNPNGPSQLWLNFRVLLFSLVLAFILFIFIRCSNPVSPTSGPERHATAMRGF